MKDLDREQWILKKLISFNGITIDDIVFKTGISERTAYNDLKRVRDTLEKEYNINIFKTENIFYLNHEDKDWLSEYLYSDDLSYSFSKTSLTYRIVQYLIKNKTTTLQNIADHLFYSKSTIYQEMESVENKLIKFKITLEKKPYHGITLRGQEKDIRFLIQYMIEEQLENVSLSLESILNSKQLITPEFSKVIELYHHKYPQLLDYEFLISVYVMYIRVKKGNDFTPSEEIEDMFKDHESYMKMSQLLTDLSETLKIKFKESETYYLLMNLDNNIIKANQENDSVKIMSKIESLLRHKYDGLELEHTSLIANLFVHVQAMLGRIALGKININPILMQTKEQIPYAFNISADIALMLKEKFNINVNEEEIGLLSMHIQTLLEKEKQGKIESINTIIVSHVGYGNTLLLMNQINYRFPEINVINRVNLSQMNLILTEETISRDTLIISTAKLPKSEYEYLYIKPIVDTKDFEKIHKYIEFKFKEDKKIKEITHMSKHLDSDIIYLKKQFKTKEELLETVCNKMFDLGYVKEGFYDSTIAREKLSSTYTLNGVSLPHGYSKYVIKPVIGIVTLEEPINWGGYYVKVVFVCAFTLNVLEGERKIIEELYDVISHKDVIEMLIETNSTDEVLSILKEGAKGEII